MLHLAEPSPHAVPRRTRRIAAGLLACALSAALLAPERARAQQWGDQVTIVDACLPLAEPGNRPSCAQKIINTVNQPNNVGLIVFYYLLTNDQIFQALLDAINRPVPLPMIVFADFGTILTDQAALNRYRMLIDRGAIGYLLPPTGEQGLQHNKILTAIRIEPVPHTPQRNWVATYVTGSYNFTYAAENYNYENMIFLETTFPETLEKLMQGSEAALNLTDRTFAAYVLTYQFARQDVVGCTNVQMQDIVRANNTYQNGFITSTYICSGATSARKR